LTVDDHQLRALRTEDGSFSLFSPAVGEAFHSGRGALAEARSKFVEPAALERWRPGKRLRVVDVGVGTGSNSAALLEAVADAGLELEWWGLELDREPLRLALADAGFRGQWQPRALQRLQELCNGAQMLWGDARARLPQLLDQRRGQIDLVLMDAFSPSRCPQLWSVEFLAGLGTLLQPGGRLLTYCSAAAVRQGLRLAGLEIASIAAPSGLRAQRSDWSGGTAASPTALGGDPRLRPLSPMELEHLYTNAAEPYRDPTGTASRSAILQERQRRQRQQLAGGAVEATSSWRRRWGLESGAGNPQ
jgi:tRNA U34 5-methylaminomethyl-2-thiouridine-forming methyltransferase MnmC